MAKLFANSDDPDQMPHSASDLGLHFYHKPFCGDSKLKWVNIVSLTCRFFASKQYKTGKPLPGKFFFSFLIYTVPKHLTGSSLETPYQGTSYEYTQYMFMWRK